MAQLDISVKGDRRKKAAPTIDLTPMVDLGFLLISFFMYTTTLMEQRSIELKMPAPANGHPMAFADTSTLTVLPVREHRVAAYTGELNDPLKVRIIKFSDLRYIIRNMQKTLLALPASYSADAHKLHVIIKPAPDSKYEDLVRTLDEMTINAVPVFVMDDITEAELMAIQK